MYPVICGWHYVHSSGISSVFYTLFSDGDSTWCSQANTGFSHILSSGGFELVRQTICWQELLFYYYSLNQFNQILIEIGNLQQVGRFSARFLKFCFFNVVLVFKISVYVCIYIYIYIYIYICVCVCVCVFVCVLDGWMDEPKQATKLYNLHYNELKELSLLKTDKISG